MTPGLGHALIKTLIAYLGSAEAVINASYSRLLKVPGIGKKAAGIVKNDIFLVPAANELEQCLKREVDVIGITDPRYPESLKGIPDSPIVLFARGKVDFNVHKKVAIVGTRRATDYGREMTEQIIKSIAHVNPLVISGLAYGIDIEAHKQALNNNLSTVAVLGHGLGTIYPSAHKKYAREIIKSGALISEYTYDITPEMHYFPSRNRIIAGYCDLLVVIEAADTGGALITADLANDYNREVVAIPGAIGAKFSEGCNRLIKDHKAHIFTSVEDMLELVGWEEEGHPQKVVTAVTPEEDNILQVISREPEGLTIDEISRKTSLAVNKVAGVLLNLEFKNLVKSLPGKRFKRRLS
jgi:DNA processing protein